MPRVAAVQLEASMHITDDTKFLTPEEMAATLRISLRTLQKMVKANTAPRHVRQGSRLLFVVERSGVG